MLDEVEELLHDKTTQPAAPSGTPSLTLTVTGSDVLALHSAASPNGGSLQAAVWLAEISVRNSGSALESRVLGSHFYLREGSDVDFSLSATSVASWFDDSGFSSVASEEELRLSVTRIGAVEELNVGARSLRVTLSKDTAVLLRTLCASFSAGQVEPGAVCPVEENQGDDEEFSVEEFTPDRVQEALQLDIRYQDDIAAKGEKPIHVSSTASD